MCVYVCAQKRGHRGLAKQKKSASLFKDNTQTIYFVYQHEPFSHLSSLSSLSLSFMYAPSLNFLLFRQMLCLCLSLVDVCIETIAFYLFFSSSLFALSSKSTAASVLLALTIWTMLINCFPKQTVPVTPRAAHQYANFIISHTHKVNSPTYRSKVQRSLIYTTRQKRVRYHHT